MLHKHFVQNDSKIKGYTHSVIYIHGACRIYTESISLWIAVYSNCDRELARIGRWGTRLRLVIGQLPEKALFSKAPL